MDIHLPFTGPSAKDRELEALREQLATTEKTISEWRIARDIADRKAEEFRRANQQNRGAYEEAAKRVDQLTKEVAELKSSLKEAALDQKAFESLFQSLQGGFDPKQLPEPLRALELARESERIADEATRGCGLYDELFTSRLNDGADRVMGNLPESERPFFRALMGGEYTPPEERDEHWKSEGQILREIQQEQLGDMSESDHGDRVEVDYERKLAEEAEVDQAETDPLEGHYRPKGTALYRVRSQVTGIKVGFDDVVDVYQYVHNQDPKNELDLKIWKRGENGAYHEMTPDEFEKDWHPDDRDPTPPTQELAAEAAEDRAREARAIEEGHWIPQKGDALPEASVFPLEKGAGVDH